MEAKKNLTGSIHLQSSPPAHSRKGGFQRNCISQTKNHACPTPVAEARKKLSSGVGGHFEKKTKALY
jgi:hypothetical protein